MKKKRKKRKEEDEARFSEGTMTRCAEIEEEGKFLYFPMKRRTFADTHGDERVNVYTRNYFIPIVHIHVVFF